jgi:integrase/recombinase XerC
MRDSFFKYLQFEKRLSQNTLTAYENDLKQFSDFIQTNYPDSTLETSDYNIIRSWIIALIDGGIGPRSANRKIAALRTYFKFLRNRGVVTKDPMAKINALKTSRKLPSFVKETDMNHLLDDVVFEDTMEGQRNKLILELFYATGVRLTELITLKESQVDLRNQTIKVLGKRNKERIIPFSKSIVQTIEAYRSKKKKEVEVGDHGFLFVTDSGGPCYPMMIYRTVKKYLSMHTSSEKINPHVLRHTYATHLLNKGAEINAVKDLLGHTSLAATQVYTHNSIEKLKKVFEQAHPKA